MTVALDYRISAGPRKRFAPRGVKQRTAQFLGTARSAAKQRLLPGPASEIF